MYSGSLARNATFLIASVFCEGCSAEESSTYSQFDLQLGRGGYELFVDDFYEFAEEYRLNVLWHGWQQADRPSKWYESDKPSDFKVKASLLHEDNGAIVAYSTLEKGTVRVSIECGDMTPPWVDVLVAFADLIRTSKAHLPKDSVGDICGL